MLSEEKNNIFVNMTTSERREVRQKIVQLVLATNIDRQNEFLAEVERDAVKGASGAAAAAALFLQNNSRRPPPPGLVAVTIANTATAGAVTPTGSTNTAPLATFNAGTPSASPGVPPLPAPAIIPGITSITSLGVPSAKQDSKNENVAAVITHVNPSPARKGSDDFDAKERPLGSDDKTKDGTEAMTETKTDISPRPAPGTNTNPRPSDTPAVTLNGGLPPRASLQRRRSKRRRQVIDEITFCRICLNRSFDRFRSASFRHCSVKYGRLALLTFDCCVFGV